MPLDTPQKNRGKSVKNVLPFENTFLELITTLKIVSYKGNVPTLTLNLRIGSNGRGLHRSLHCWYFFKELFLNINSVIENLSRFLIQRIRFLIE